MKIKHFTIIFTFLFVVATLISSWIYLYNSRTNVMITLRNLKGEDTYLNDITIMGEIVDERQKLSFSLNENKIKSKYEYGVFNKNYPSVTSNSRMVNFDANSINRISGFYDFKISADAHTRSDYERDKMAGLSGNWIFTDKLDVYLSLQSIRIITDLKIYRPQQDMAVFSHDQSSKESRTGSEPKGLFQPNGFHLPALFVGENNYVITYTDENYSGTGGLYLMNNNNIHNINLLPIDLENGKVQIRFSFVVGERIVVLVTKDKKLIAYVYDTKQNRKLGEISIDDSETDSVIEGIQSNGYGVIRQRLQGVEDQNRFYVIDLNKLSIIDFYMKDEIITNNREHLIFYNVLYKKDILFILTHRYPGRGFRDGEEIFITACKNGELLCDSVLDTDLRKDPAGIQNEDGYYLSPRIFQNMRME